MAYEDLILPGLGALAGMAIGIVVLIAIAFYAYFAMAWMTIGQKLKYKYPWLAWIPFANVAMILQMGGFHWAWAFLIFIPILGWIALFVLSIISSWRIYEKRRYPGWLALIPIGSGIPILGGFFSLANLIVIGFVAWKDK